MATLRAGIVLAGGRSSRMGRPKAWLPWFGRTMIEHVVERLRVAVDEVVVVTSADLDLPGLEARIVRDRDPERGPLAGLRDGLKAIRAPLAFVTSTDAPHLRPEHVERMLARGGACAPVEDGHVQVLSAVYPRAAASLAERMLDAGKGRPLDLLAALDCQAIPRDEASTEDPPPWQGFNTPEAYLAAVRAVDPRAGCSVELLGRAALAARTTLFERPVGTLAEVLASLPAPLALLDGDRVSRAYLVSLGGRDLVRDASLPVGPGERISVLDAQAGG